MTSSTAVSLPSGVRIVHDQGSYVIEREKFGWLAWNGELTTNPEKARRFRNLWRAERYIEKPGLPREMFSDYPHLQQPVEAK